MRATDRFWALAGLPVLLTGWAVVLDRAVPLFAAAGVCAWLLAQQYRFTRLFSRTVDELTVAQRLSTEVTVTGNDTYFSLSASREAPRSVTIGVEPSPPAAADTAVEPIWMAADEREVATSAAVSWPVAGVFEFEPCTATVRDTLGLFEQRFECGPKLTATVESLGSDEIHVGEGGTPVAVGFGDHSGKRTGEGNESQQVREYVPGDTLRQIDWKATARLGETHIREFTAQSERRTVLFVDHRACMDTGPVGKTKLAVARELGLGIAENARRTADPLGCYTVNDGGITGMFEPLTGTDHYEQVRQHLQRLEATSIPSSNGGPGASRTAAGTDAASRIRSNQSRMARYRSTKTETTMGRRLAPFFQAPSAVVEAITEDPLFSAIESITERISGTPWTMILADDSHPVELREAVKTARHRGGPVLVFLFPNALYGEGKLSDIDGAYARYTEFERYRASLAKLDGVSAFEVGPADRVESVLSRARERDDTTGGSNV